jgi:hypothetical protein
MATLRTLQPEATQDHVNDAIRDRKKYQGRENQLERVFVSSVSYWHNVFI